MLAHASSETCQATKCIFFELLLLLLSHGSVTHSEENAYHTHGHTDAPDWHVSLGLIGEKGRREHPCRSQIKTLSLTLRNRYSQSLDNRASVLLLHHSEA